MTIAVDARPLQAVRGSATFATAYGEVVPTVTRAQMQRLEQRWLGDRRSAPEHLAALAGVRLASVVAGWQTAGPLRVTVAVGGGWNGAAGVQAACALAQMGHAVAVVPVMRGRRAAAVLEPLHRAVVQVVDAADREAALSGADVVVDAILAGGLAGRVRGPVAEAIRDVNRLSRRIVAADVPSGLDADTGAARGAVVRPTVTVAFGLPKAGLARVDAPSDLLLADLRFAPTSIRDLGLAYADPFHQGPVVALRRID